MPLYAICVLLPVFLQKAFQTFWQFLNFSHRFLVPEFNGGFARCSLCSSAELGRDSGCRAPWQHPWSQLASNCLDHVTIIFRMKGGERFCTSD